MGTVKSGLFIYDRYGKLIQHLSFEVAKLHGEDKFSRIHICYQTKIASANPTQDEATEKQKKTDKKKSKKQAAESEDDLPF